jgi:hypothetical protein
MASSGNPKGSSIAGEQHEPRIATTATNGNPEDNHFNEKYDDAEDDAVSISDQKVTTTVEERSDQPALHLTSDEVNYLIFRYVDEVVAGRTENPLLCNLCVDGALVMIVFASVCLCL